MQSATQLSYFEVMTAKTNIAIVDDHVILLDGLEALLLATEKFEVIAKEVSGEDLLKRTDLANIDVLLMDINMKDKDGIQILRELRATGFQGKCILLSSYNDLRLVNEAFDVGADGYITKNSATDCLAEGIELVQSGERYYSPDIRKRIIRAFSKNDTEVVETTQEQSVMRQLTEREREVLKYIAQQYTSEEIAKKLYIAKSTVDTHRKNLIYKLKVKNAVGLGLFAERHGLI